MEDAGRAAHLLLSCRPFQADLERLDGATWLGGQCGIAAVCASRAWGAVAGARGVHVSRRVLSAISANISANDLEVAEERAPLVRLRLCPRLRIRIGVGVFIRRRPIIIRLEQPEHDVARLLAKRSLLRPSADDDETTLQSGGGRDVVSPAVLSLMNTDQLAG